MALPVDALGYVLYAHGAVSRRAGLRVVRPWRCQSTRRATCRTPMALSADAVGYASYAHGAASCRPGLRVVRPRRWQLPPWATCCAPPARELRARRTPSGVTRRASRSRHTGWPSCSDPSRSPRTPSGWPAATSSRDTSTTRWTRCGRHTVPELMHPGCPLLPLQPGKQASHRDPDPLRRVVP